MEVITPGPITEETSNAKGKWKAKRKGSKAFRKGLKNMTRQDRRAAKYSKRKDKRHAKGRYTIKELWLQKKKTWGEKKAERVKNRTAKQTARKLEMDEDKAVTGGPEQQVITFKDQIPVVEKAQTKDGKEVLVKETPIGKKEVKAEDVKSVIVDGESILVDKNDVKDKEIKTIDGGLVVELDESEVSEVDAGDGISQFYRNEDVTDSTGWWSGLSTKKKVMYGAGLVVATGFTFFAIMYAVKASKTAKAAGASGAKAVSKAK